MIFDHRGRLRLTRSHLNRLRKHNAQQGFVVNDIHSMSEYGQALVNGLPDHIVEDMLQFFETGDSPLIRQGARERGVSDTPPSRGAINNQREDGPIDE